jgi:hypothetical protein
MVGTPEREDAMVHQIRSHPKYRSHFNEEPPPLFDQRVDEELTNMLAQAGQEAEEEAASLQLAERNAVGNNVCWQCTHRQDRRPLWKRLLFTPNEMSYLCGAVQRTQVADPVSGQVRWIERMRGMLGGTQLVLVDTPHRPCVELNLDGQCQMFNLALAKRKQRRKEKR